MGCGASASPVEQPVGSATELAKYKRRHRAGVWSEMPPRKSELNGQLFADTQRPEPLPVLVGRSSSQWDGKGRKQVANVSPARRTLSRDINFLPFSKVESSGSDDSSNDLYLLKDILTDALVSPVTPEAPDARTKLSNEAAQGFPMAPPNSPTQQHKASPTPPEKQPGPRAPTSNCRKTHMKRSSTGPSAKQEKPQSIERCIEQKQDTAATKVQKHYRGHRVRTQAQRVVEYSDRLSLWGEQLEPVVEEEAQKKVTFAESPTAQIQDEFGRASARKSTPFIRKEDLPAEEYGLKIGTAQSLTAELEDECSLQVSSAHNLIDESSLKLRAGRKSTPFIRMEEVPADSDTDMDFPSDTDTPSSDMELQYDKVMEDHPSEKVVKIAMPETPSEKPSRNLRAERKPTGYVRKADVPDDTDSDSEPEEFMGKEKKSVELRQVSQVDIVQHYQRGRHWEPGSDSEPEEV